jgi:hypothetical protein
MVVLVTVGQRRVGQGCISAIWQYNVVNAMLYLILQNGNIPLCRGMLFIVVLLPLVYSWCAVG